MGKKSNEVIKILKSFKKRVESSVKLKKLILFGSQARGNANKSSDIDLILVSEDFKNKKSYQRSAPFYLQWDYDYNTDIICLTPQELEVKR
jgi:predicted nucleotidyltransferase